MTRLSKLILLILFVAALDPATGFAQTDPCDDLTGIDFGLCEAILGWGVIGGTCQPISGCPPSPVPLFASQSACEEACAPVPSCDDLGHIDFGDCDAVLGVGVIDGECVAISGCESPVPLFASLSECAAQCQIVGAAELTWSTIKSRYQGR